MQQEIERNQHLSAEGLRTIDGLWACWFCRQLRVRPDQRRGFKCPEP